MNSVEEIKAQAIFGPQGPGGGGHIIHENGTPLPQQPILEFTGAGASVTNGTGKTVVNIPGGGGGANDVVYFEPGIGATTGNRYKTLAEIQTVVNATATMVDVYIISPGIFNTIAIPAAAYNFSKCRFFAAPGTILPNLSFDDGTTLNGMPFRMEQVVFTNNNTTAPLFTVTGFALFALVTASLQNPSSATQPFIKINSGGQVQCYTEGNLNPLYSASSTYELVNMHGIFAIAVLSIPEDSFFGANNIFSDDGSGEGSLQINYSSLVTGGYHGVNPNLAGGVSVNPVMETRVNELISAARPIINDSLALSDADISADGTAPTGMFSGGLNWIKANGITLLEVIVPFGVPGIGNSVITVNLPFTDNPDKPPIVGNFPVFLKGTYNQTSACDVEFKRKFGGPAYLKFTLPAPSAVSHLYARIAY